MAANAQRIAPYESFERGGAALFVSSCQKQPQAQRQRRILGAFQGPIILPGFLSYFP